MLYLRNLPNRRAQRCSMFSSVNVTVLGFTFRSMIHLELLFVCCVSDGWKFFLKKYEHLNVPAAFVEKTAFLLNWEISFALCWKSISHMYVGLFQDFILFHCSICIPWCHYHTLCCFFQTENIILWKYIAHIQEVEWWLPGGGGKEGWGVTV